MGNATPDGHAPQAQEEIRPPAAPMQVQIGPYRFAKAAYGQTETAGLLDTTRQHVAKQVREGKIRTVPLGRRVLVPVTEIARLLGWEESAEPSSDDGGRAA